MDKMVEIKQSNDDLMNTYDVIDTIENRKYMSNVTAIEIAEKFKINKRKVYNHHHSGYLLEQRYLIDINTKVDKSLKARWDKARFTINPYARRNNDHDK